MSLPTLADLRELGGARVLLRLDLNVPVKDGAVQDATRIEASLPTLRWLLERVSVVAACSHLGDAKGKPDPALSLLPVAAALERALGRPVRFVADCLDPAAGKAAPGSLLLLENLRFHKGEKANDPEFAKQLAAPFSHYVNDAFGAAHRAHASVAAAPALFAPGRKAAGLLMGTEVAALYRMVHEPEQPYVAVVGGAKISTKTAPLAALLERVELLLIGGGMANTMLLAQGREVGRSLVEREMLETASAVLRRAAERGVRIELPTDVVVADAIASPTRVEVVAADAVPADMMIVDIGPAHAGALCRGDRRRPDRVLERPDGRLRDRRVRGRHDGRGAGARRVEGVHRRRRRRVGDGRPPRRSRRRHRPRVDRRRRLARVHHRQGPARDRGAGGVMAASTTAGGRQLEDAHGRGGDRHASSRPCSWPGRPAASMSSSARPSPRCPMRRCCSAARS